MSSTLEQLNTMDLNVQVDSLQSCTDAHLVRLIRQRPRLIPSSCICLLSANLLVKRYELALVEDVVRAMDTACQLGIRVPHFKRIIECDGDTYCIMECIEGTTLEEAWAKLSWFTRSSWLCSFADSSIV